jgi:predicted DNA-binding transcriptional regulator AlpA
MREELHTSGGRNANQLLLTTDEAADVLRVGRTTVYSLIREGQL